MAVKWGIIGTAGIAAGCTIPGMKRASGCELYAIAGRSREKTEQFKERFGFEKAYEGYDALLQDPEVQAVYIALPNHLHCEWTLRALEAGKHVLCEKPLALNPEEAQRMFACAEKNGVHLMEAYAYLHSPYVAALREDISSGLIGQVDYIDTAFLGQSYTEDFRLHRAFGGGSFYDLGCYCTSMALTLAQAAGGGELPVLQSVHAAAEFSDDGVDMQTIGFMTLQSGESFLRAGFNVGMVFPPNSLGRYDRLYVHGSKGSIRSEVAYNQPGELTYRVIVDRREIERHVTSPWNYTLEVEQMTRAIEGKEKPLVTPAFSILTADVIGAVLKEIHY